jgi:hypothetical protein
VSPGLPEPIGKPPIAKAALGPQANPLRRRIAGTESPALPRFARWPRSMRALSAIILSAPQGGQTDVMQLKTRRWPPQAA